MDNQQTLDRIHDKLENIAVSIGVIHQQVYGTNARLDALNSKVATHSLQINQHELAMAKRESDSLLHTNEVAELRKQMDAMQTASKIDSATWLKIVGLVCLTSAAIFGVSSGKILEVIASVIAK